MPALSDYAQRKKIEYFLQPIPKDAKILEIGSGSGWVGSYLKDNGWTNYHGMDIVPPADVVGDITDWKNLDIEASSFDVIVAFEVVEHVDIYPACEALLKKDGKLLVTTPLPHTDWIMQLLELVKLNQTRTSEHCNLHYLKPVNGLIIHSKKNIAGLSQWGIFAKA
jgi:2-polyprenyl-3-methyl-5-hydroxy-6-metoxy-1,4-benzoquinol methylase